MVSLDDVLNDARIDGEERLPNGVWLIKPAPEIGPKAWMHITYPPLSESELAAIENQLHRRFPLQMQKFFRRFNGLSLFGRQLTIWGKRKDYIRQGPDAWQPFDIVEHNAPGERPSGSPYSVLYFGSSDQGANRLYLDDEAIGRTSSERYEPEDTWPDFESFFNSELARLAANS